LTQVSLDAAAGSGLGFSFGLAADRCGGPRLVTAAATKQAVEFG
jgi:hypothetical protein